MSQQRDAAACSRHAQAVPRRAALSVGQFYDQFVSKRQPVIITDAATDWPAREKWSWDYLQRECGDDTVTVRLGPGERGLVNLGEYIEYVQKPASRPLDRPPPYLVDWDFRAAHPGMARDLTPPDFARDWLDLLPPALRPALCWIFIGPTHSGGPLHIDTRGTHAWLTQLIGKKHWLLFPPDALPLTYCNAADAFAPDVEAFPLLANSQCLHATLRAGETIFVPYGWRHQVKNIEPSLAVTANYVDASNWHDAWADVGLRAPLEDVLIAQAKRLIAEPCVDPLEGAWQRAWIGAGLERLRDERRRSVEALDRLLGITLAPTKERGDGRGDA